MDGKTDFIIKKRCQQCENFMASKMCKITKKTMKQTARRGLSVACSMLVSCFYPEDVNNMLLQTLVDIFWTM
jgi:hypothetical protein